MGSPSGSCWGRGSARMDADFSGIEFVASGERMGRGPAGFYRVSRIANRVSRIANRESLIAYRVSRIANRVSQIAYRKSRIANRALSSGGGLWLVLQPHLAFKWGHNPIWRLVQSIHREWVAGDGQHHRVTILSGGSFRASGVGAWPSKTCPPWGTGKPCSTICGCSIRCGGPGAHRRLRTVCCRLEVSSSRSGFTASEPFCSLFPEMPAGRPPGPSGSQVGAPLLPVSLLSAPLLLCSLFVPRLDSWRLRSSKFSDSSDSPIFNPPVGIRGV